MVAAAKRKLSGADDNKSGSATDGPVGKVKSALSKATQAMTGLVKKDDGPAGGSATAAHDEPTDNSLKMKAAVEEARKARDAD